MAERLSIFFFIGSLVLPWAVSIIGVKKTRKWKIIYPHFGSAIIIYASILVVVHIENLSLEKQLYSYDLNHDGVFSPSETTPGFEKAMEAYTNDTGSAMAPIIGAIFSVLYVSFVLLTIEFASWVGRLVRANRT